MWPALRARPMVKGGKCYSRIARASLIVSRNLALSCEYVVTGIIDVSFSRSLSLLLALTSTRTLPYSLPLIPILILSLSLSYSLVLPIEPLYLSQNIII